ncbi:hypothetical protein Agabi119p4_7092 [Agaricus bisporus var. burnettii]|uniref:Uncharacterized protein n=1 Tax=Agaricus bisporus var. burnettii TaxID=192524 RepID=A0A8H7F0R2_AGABI|nr:hypothetical protein Agabi119p4_7092 [Agaricus bisporus var. burnettii]
MQHLIDALQSTSPPTRDPSGGCFCQASRRSPGSSPPSARHRNPETRKPQTQTGRREEKTSRRIPFPPIHLHTQADRTENTQIPPSRTESPSLSEGRVPPPPNKVIHALPPPSSVLESRPWRNFTLDDDIRYIPVNK